MIFWLWVACTAPDLPRIEGTLAVDDADPVPVVLNEVTHEASWPTQGAIGGPKGLGYLHLDDGSTRSVWMDVVLIGFGDPETQLVDGDEVPLTTYLDQSQHPVAAGVTWIERDPLGAPNTEESLLFLSRYQNREYSVSGVLRIESIDPATHLQGHLSATLDSSEDPDRPGVRHLELDFTWEVTE